MPNRVTIVSWFDGEVQKGITVNSFTSVSLDPPLALVSIHKEAKACNSMKDKSFTINIFIVTAMYCGYSIGSILASLIGMYVMEQLSWMVLYWIGALPLLALPFFRKQFPESLSYYVIREQGAKIAGILNRIDPDGDYKESDDYEFAKVQERAKGFPVKKLFEKKRTLSTFAFWVAAFNCLLMVYGLNTWLPKIMQQSGYGLTSSLFFNLISGIGQIGGSIIGGYLVGKIGHRRVLVSLYAIGTACFVLLGLTSNPIALYILIAFGGACTVGTMNLANTYISEYYPREIRTTGIGWALAFGRIGAIVAPILIGLLLACKLFAAKCIHVLHRSEHNGCLGFTRCEREVWKL
ncbi:MFS transporter [Peribacillus frigoritolerans]